MTTTIELNANELNGSLLKSLKAMFKGKKIRLTIDAELDETEYLNKSEANRIALEKSIAQLKEGKLITLSLDELQK
jgi:hypothetical protein